VKVEPPQLLAGALLLVLLSALAGWLSCVNYRPPKTALEEESASDVFAGLQLTVRSLNKDGARLHLVFAFEWAGEPDFWFWRPWTALQLSYWDAEGRELEPSAVEFVWVSEAFRRRKVRYFEDAVVIDLPKGARYVAYMLRPELMTRKVALPE
jgi:hypothetical protein